MVAITWFIVCYDISVTADGGARRLRRAERYCTSVCERVNDSVYEFHGPEAVLQRLVERLRALLDFEVDSLRIYRLPVPIGKYRTVYGPDFGSDPDLPLVF